MSGDIEIARKAACAACCVVLVAIIAAFIAGSRHGDSLPCEHDKPYEIKDSTRGIMLIVPEGWYAVPILDEFGRPYKRPTDQ